MIKFHCNVLLHGSQSYHAEVHINPIGEVDIDILESKQHLSSEFDQLKFQRKRSGTQLQGVEQVNQKPWHIELAHQDAKQVSRLIKNANEEYEQLMCDLM
ncbi:hypothetical protein [Vibrio hippocampi]|uniref:Uncharacterized protein n=1 Tax=Vibrio hippocampi TaxID=654686 RepID=A0ABN8DEI3_9VIBR|nr:hypothetical protein [Vibrio hippocampi]CAH0525476.1 hypothetical protein VHP8226_00999 [Vibrio hippocampi]